MSVGLVAGVIDRLDQLARLGVDAVWLNPSPGTGSVADVGDPFDVDPRLGGFADLDELVARAKVRGIRVIMDLVASHTSNRHPWFVSARSSRDNAFRDFYVWRDPGHTGPEWTLDEATGQCYRHTLGARRPDLNWESRSVRAAFDSALRFWLDRGVAGFRIDVAHDAALERRRVVEGHDLDAVLLGAAGDGDAGRLHLVCTEAPADGAVERLKEIVREAERALPSPAWPAWLLAGDDAGRGPTGDAEATLALLLTLRGTPVLDDGVVVDSRSTERLVRDVISLRREWPDLASGSYRELPAPAGLWLYRRGAETVVAVNRTGAAVTVPLRHERVLLSTAGECGVGGARLELPPHSTVVVAGAHD